MNVRLSYCTTECYLKCVYGDCIWVISIFIITEDLNECLVILHIPHEGNRQDKCELTAEGKGGWGVQSTR